MTNYVRKLAWLSAKPDGSKKTRREQFTELNENHSSLSLPDLSESHAGYIIVLLHECGLMSSNGMGPCPLSWTEIHNWLSVTKRDLPTFEINLIKHLSNEYVSEYYLASDINRPDPHKSVDYKSPDRRKAVSDSIRAVMTNIKEDLRQRR